MNTEPFALPFQVRLRPYWNASKRIGLGLCLAITQATYVVIALSTQPSKSNMPQWMFWSLLESDFVLAGLFTVAFIGATSRMRLLVTDEGITTRAMGMQHQVLWKNARLFTILPSGAYKLASPRDAVLLFLMDDPKKAARRPDIPFEEYQRKMDGLLLLIAERTGLPLMDLRDVEDR